MLLGGFFNNPFEDEEFDLVLILWFDMTMSLYRWGKLLQESTRILKKGGLLGFDFMDSQDRLLDVISRESNPPYFLVNGKDIEIIARNFSLTKVLEFNEGFNEKIAKYHLYAKRES